MLSGFSPPYTIVINIKPLSSLLKYGAIVLSFINSYFKRFISVIMFRKDNTYYKNNTGLHTNPSDQNYLRDVHVKDFFFKDHSQGSNQSICPSDCK